MLENLLVALIVTSAALYAAWVLWPRRARNALQKRLGMRVDPPAGCDRCGDGHR
ncbi:MAG: hypothetical protein R3E65_01405 [Steroidobacteraceae bacterium]